jgi:hypothetical protein
MPENNRLTGARASRMRMKIVRQVVDRVRMRRRNEAVGARMPLLEAWDLEECGVGRKPGVRKGEEQDSKGEVG